MKNVDGPVRRERLVDGRAIWYYGDRIGSSHPRPLATVMTGGASPLAFALKHQVSLEGGQLLVIGPTLPDGVEGDRDSWYIGDAWAAEVWEAIGARYRVRAVVHVLPTPPTPPSPPSLYPLWQTVREVRTKLEAKTQSGASWPLVLLGVGGKGPRHGNADAPGTNGSLPALVGARTLVLWVGDRVSPESVTDRSPAQEGGEGWKPAVGRAGAGASDGDAASDGLARAVRAGICYLEAGRPSQIWCSMTYGDLAAGRRAAALSAASTETLESLGWYPCDSNLDPDTPLDDHMEGGGFSD